MAKRLPILILIAAVGYGAYYYFTLPPKSLVLTGIVTTHDVSVAPQIGGRLVSLLVKEGDEVKKGQALAEIDPGELRAERAYFEHSAEGIASQVRESEAALRLQERQLTDQVKQAEAAVATSEAQRAAAAADVERAKVTVDRTRELFKQQLAPAQAMDEARTAYEAALARLDSTARRCAAARCRPRSTSSPPSAHNATRPMCVSPSQTSSPQLMAWSMCSPPAKVKSSTPVRPC
jgi:multidrug resistance efflux pump